MRTLLLLVFCLISACAAPKGPGDVAPITFPCVQADDSTARGRILIIGDSISIGYSTTVISALCAEGYFVTRIPVNGRATAYARAHLDSWLGAREWDVVTFNEGVWDTDLATGAPYTSIEAYVDNVAAIAARIGARSRQTIFALTTHAPLGCTTNDDDTIVAYNDAARAALNGTRTRIVDLYARSLDLTPRSPLNIHYDAAGYESLGQVMIDAIRRALPQ